MPNIRQAIIIGSPIEKVYDAISSQEGLAAWWTPYAQAEAVLRSVARFPFGDGYFKEMEITALKPNELVQWNCMKGDDQWIGTNLTFSLLSGSKETLLVSHPEMRGQLEQLETKNGTLLLFQHDGWKDYTLMFAECSHTWGQFLRSLKLLCETGVGHPWPNQHRV
jgi:uncharacterized protein YndB with AHSA1/START domain